MRIETERLDLRSATLEDAPLLLDLFRRPEVRKYLEPSPEWTIERARQAVEYRRKLEAERGFAQLVVRTKVTGEFIGNAGLHPSRGSSLIELLYHYLPAAWGKGYGTEVAVAWLDYAFRSLRLEKVIAVCIPQNVGSWRVMEKAGMRYVGLESFFGKHRVKKYIAERGTWVPPERAN